MLGGVFLAVFVEMVLGWFSLGGLYDKIIV